MWCYTASFSEELKARLGIKSILDVLRQRRLRWFGHVERRDNSWLQKIHHLEIVGKSGCVVDPAKPGNRRLVTTCVSGHSLSACAESC